MKRLFTILIAIILCSFTSSLFSQNFNKADFNPKVENGQIQTASEILLNKKLTSVLGQIWIPSSWVDDTRQMYDYTDAGLMSKLEFQKIENSEWKTEMEVQFEYNGENQMVVDYMWFYEDDGSIGMGTKWEQTYAGNNVVEAIRSEWDVDNSKWEIDLKWESEYSNELISKITEYRFVLDWELSQQYTYTYNAQGKQIEELIEIWNESGNVFENSNLTTTTYYPNGQISEEISKSWDIDNQQWSEENYYLYEFQYDANGNRIEYMATMAIEFSGFSMLTKTKLQSEYDSNNYLIEDLDFNWDDNSSAWIELSKSEYSNDTEGNPLVVIIYNKLSGAWDYSEKLTYNYDGAVGFELDKNSIPETFSLSQNYPNPFNPTTTIKYSIPVVDANFTSTTNVILKVYDALGKKITTLVNENKSPGNYEVEFNASDLTSGIYFYSLKSGNNVMTKKSLLVK